MRVVYSGAFTQRNEMRKQMRWQMRFGIVPSVEFPEELLQKYIVYFKDLAMYFKSTRVRKLGHDVL